MQYLPLAIAVIVGIIGCASPTPRFIPYTEVAYAPSETVLVLHAMPSDRTYVELGEVSVLVGMSNQGTHVMALRNMASQIGAHAIVLLGDRYTAAPVTRIRVTPMREAIAIAIRYTPSEPARDGGEALKAPGVTGAPRGPATSESDAEEERAMNHPGVVSQREW